MPVGNISFRSQKKTRKILLVLSSALAVIRSFFPVFANLTKEEGKKICKARENLAHCFFYHIESKAHILQYVHGTDSFLQGQKEHY